MEEADLILLLVDVDGLSAQGTQQGGNSQGQGHTRKSLLPEDA